jgi:hypothetical protein
VRLTCVVYFEMLSHGTCVFGRGMPRTTSVGNANAMLLPYSCASTAATTIARSANILGV